MTLEEYHKIIKSLFAPNIHYTLNRFCSVCYIHIYEYRSSPGGISKSNNFKATKIMNKKTYLLVKQLLESKDKDNITIVKEIFKSSV